MARHGGGPDGAEVLAFGAPNTENKDAEMRAGLVARGRLAGAASAILEVGVGRMRTILPLATSWTTKTSKPTSRPLLTPRPLRRMWASTMSPRSR